MRRSVLAVVCSVGECAKAGQGRGPDWFYWVDAVDAEPTGLACASRRACRARSRLEETFEANSSIILRSSQMASQIPATSPLTTMTDPAQNFPKTYPLPLILAYH